MLTQLFIATVFAGPTGSDELVDDIGVVAASGRTTQGRDSPLDVPRVQVPTSRRKPKAEPKPETREPEPRTQPEGPAPRAEPTPVAPQRPASTAAAKPAPKFIEVDGPPKGEEPALTKAQERRKRFQHKGFQLTLQSGVGGCTGNFCAGAGRMAADPGVRVDGFLGGNAGGWFEAGLRGGWGRFTPQGVEGKLLPDMFGFDTTQAQLLAEELDFDLGQFELTGAEASMATGGVALRIHLIPRGRAMFWVGSGVAYSLFRADFQTGSGNARLDFHGFTVPVEGGLGFYLHPKIALIATGSYMWTDYLVVDAQLPSQNLAAPLGSLDRELSNYDANLSGDLPHFWTATAGFRLTI